MLLKDRKMIYYKCDLCKEEIPKNKDSKLTLRTINEIILWELCDNCIPKIKEMLGTGRIFNAKH